MVKIKPLPSSSIASLMLKAAKSSSTITKVAVFANGLIDVVPEDEIKSSFIISLPSTKLSSKTETLIIKLNSFAGITIDPFIEDLSPVAAEAPATAVDTD
eukprot:TRINITY_DN3432_c0_g1_i1.p1 TRINITY_DN3432_c0_g1~~TRINITY_DN3432_c0_g1_i1.p1  ORF type:complete len:100 (+),score=14.28 TRINITY_DN3432_c0_g1_i1:149-448(+)